MSYQHVQVERRGHVMLIGIDRPEKANAFNPQIASSDARPTHTVTAGDVKASLDGAQPVVLAAQTTAPATSTTTKNRL